MKNAELWKKIQAFSFDDPSDVYGFTLRLANENLWTRDFTHKAIEEYKRFMYLATISETMVSPSHIIDQVWHLHLIYTKSYDNFCDILGKKIQHVPATHNPKEGRIFIDARQRTNDIYQSEFGEQPVEFWMNREMTDSLCLRKSKYKLRSFIIVGILCLAALLLPLYFALRLLYVQIGSANFITGYLVLIGVVFIALHSANRIIMNRTYAGFQRKSFIHRLVAAELIYLQYDRIESVVNGYLNHLIKSGHISVNAGDMLEAAKKDDLESPEESQIIQLLNVRGKTSYPVLMKNLTTRNIFSNIETSICAFKKYYLKSVNFHRLFYWNFIIMSLLFAIGFERIMTGIMRDKPVVYITIVVMVVVTAIVIHLFLLTRQMFTRIIPDIYEKKVKANTTARSNWQWHYFLMGTAVYAPAFATIADMTYTEGMNVTNRRTGSGGSSCGSSCGNSCGSSCGGASCGGCGGGD